MNTSQRRKAFGVEGLRPCEAPAILNIRLGALFVLGARRKFDRKTLVDLMIERCGFSEKSAQQLAHHWLASEPYRLNTQYERPRRWGSHIARIFTE